MPEQDISADLGIRAKLTITKEFVDQYPTAFDGIEHRRFRANIEENEDGTMYIVFVELTDA